MEMSRRWTLGVAGVTLGLLVGAAPTYAVDGVVLVDQARALAGGVTPGDQPGFPVTITKAGTYRLSTNLVVPDADTSAFKVTANDVTIDLNGFTIVGPTVCPIVTPNAATYGYESIVTSCAPAGAGIGIDAGVADPSSSAGPTRDYQINVHVLNGTIRGMGSHGIVLGLNGYVEGVTVISNGGTGIFAGRGSIIKNNQATGNGGAAGFYIGNANYIVGNVATLNAARGFAVGSGLMVQNVAHRNGTFSVVQFGDSNPHVFVDNSFQP